MKYTVSMRVDGRIDVEVNAESAEEAFRKSTSEIADADLSKMEVVELCPVNCTDENGELTDF